MTHRQLALIRHALKHGSTVYTVESHSKSHGVVTQTARSDLDALVARNLLTKSKRGSANVYHPVGELSDRLEALTAGPP